MKGNIKVSVIFSLSFLLLPVLVFAIQDSTSKKFLSAMQDLKHSKQLLLLLTDELHSKEGTLQQFEKNEKNEWNQVGHAIPVVIGKNGLAFESTLLAFAQGKRIKQEGDGCTPVGIFKLGPAFGFEKKPDFSMKFPYLAVTDQTVCVDDPNSRHYNQIIDYSKVKKLDWKSSEKMLSIPQYEFASVVQNNHPIVAGEGSCIFIHSWEKLSEKGTKGCIAMDPNHLKKLLVWANITNHPTIVILPHSTYLAVRQDWKLPELKEQNRLSALS